MIRRLDAAMRSDLAAAPVDRGLALFEAAMMTRCAQLPGDGGRGRGARAFGSGGTGREPGLLLEVGTRAAAHRFRTSLAGLTSDVQIRVRAQGLRHQYEVCQLVVPPADEPKVAARLRRAWHTGTLLLTTPGHLTDCLRRRAAARAVWRAALLVAGPGRGPHCLRVRLVDGEAASALGEGAAVLGLAARTLRRPGAHIVAVEGAETISALLSEVGSDAPCIHTAPALVRAG